VTIEIREAEPQDAQSIAPLLEQLMHRPTTPDQVLARFEHLRDSDMDCVLVAVDEGSVVGLAAVHVAWMIHTDRPTGRLMSLVVDERVRRAGVGRALVEASCRMAREAGCDRMELTSRLEREGAHAFYEQVGFQHTSRRFSMPL
jgi:predicted N-acetyltransferase YhbS